MDSKKKHAVLRLAGKEPSANIKKVDIIIQDSISSIKRIPLSFSKKTLVSY